MTTHTNPRRVSRQTRLPGLGLPFGAPAPPPASLARLRGGGGSGRARRPGAWRTGQAEAAAALLRSCGRARRATSEAAVLHGGQAG